MRLNALIPVYPTAGFIISIVGITPKVQRGLCPAMKLVVFATSTNFLDWTRRFDAQIIMPSKSSGVKYFISKIAMPNRIRSLSKWADVVFADFLTPYAKMVMHNSHKPVYLRIHRWELDYPESFDGVNWANVAAVIGVSAHYGKLLREYVPKQIPIHVIPPGVVAGSWPFKPSSTGKVCTWAIPTPRKRIYGLMLALRGIPFHVGGYSAKDRILIDINKRYSLGHILEPNVEFPQFLWDKEYYVHHALDESFGVAIGEAMLSGLIPLVHRLPCVLEYLPEELTYIYNSELRDLLERMRNMLPEDRDDLKHKLRKIILEGYTSDVTGQMMERLFLKGSV